MAWSYKEYEEGEAVKRAREQYEALQAPSPYQSAYQDRINSVVGKIENRKPFTYDVNGDALYQLYKGQYMTAGKQAMQDTMGQAAALTGGYGNSYASSAGNQAYQAYLGRLNEAVPELYQLAYNRYQQEGQDLQNLYALYSDRENTDYGRYRDLVGDYQTDRGFYAGRYDSERSWDYGMYTDARNRSLEEYKLALAEAQAASSGGGSGGSGRSRKSGGGSGGGNNALTTDEINALYRDTYRAYDLIPLGQTAAQDGVVCRDMANGGTVVAQYNPDTKTVDLYKNKG